MSKFAVMRVEKLITSEECDAAVRFTSAFVTGHLDLFRQRERTLLPLLQIKLVLKPRKSFDIYGHVFIDIFLSRG